MFFNGCANQYKPEYHQYMSHFEMEDLPLSNEEIGFETENGKVKFIVPEVNCHTTIVVEY